MLTLLTAADYRRVRWKNGRGWTTGLAARPINGDLDWHVRIAKIDADCRFVARCAWSGALVLVRLRALGTRYHEI